MKLSDYFMSALLSANRFRKQEFFMSQQLRQLAFCFVAALNLHNSKTLVEGEIWLCLQQEFVGIDISMFSNVGEHRLINLMSSYQHLVILLR